MPKGPQFTTESLRFSVTSHRWCNIAGSISTVLMLTKKNLGSKSAFVFINSWTPSFSWSLTAYPIEILTVERGVIVRVLSPRRAVITYALETESTLYGRLFFISWTAMGKWSERLATHLRNLFPAISETNESFVRLSA
ncbi:hypothetical protein TNCV_4917981 [Trichonephila clavipes]|nr:hypothetical protein TNCV_4917981 [Trichonephila clavipes]